MTGTTERAFAAGSEYPALEKGRMRLYSMRFCPFAQRTRLVLQHKNIPYETININLASKPAWFVERNPKGQVPTLEKDGEIVYESRDCNQHLDEKFPDNNLTPQDPATRERHKQIADNYDKIFIPLYYKLLRASATDKPDVIKQLLDATSELEKQLTDLYFGGKQPAMIDFLIWPWIERLASVSERLTGLQQFPQKDRFPRLNAHVQAMFKRPDVNATVFSGDMHEEFYKSVAADGPTNYDVGL